MGRAIAIGMLQFASQVIIKLFKAVVRVKALAVALQILLLVGFLVGASSSFAQNLRPLQEWSVSQNGTNNEVHQLYPENSIQIQFDVVALESTQRQQSFLDVETDLKTVSVRYVLYASESDLKNPIKLLKYLLLMQSISGKFVLDESNLSYVSDGRLTVAELIANKKAGSSMAELSLQSMYKDSLKELTVQNPLNDLIKKMSPRSSREGFDSRVKNEILDAEKEIEILADKEKQKFHRKLSNWSESIKAIEYDQEISRNLVWMIKRNDRKGFAQIMDALIPWELLEPSEKTLWSQWLEAIKNPAQNNLTVVFRGSYRGSDNPKKVYQRASRIKGIKSFTNFWRLKLKERDPKRSFQLGQQANLTVNSEIRSHASNSEKSPFLSFTSDFQTAAMFAEPNIVVAKVDPRRLIVNSNNPGESEFLIPLVLFPDEVSQLLRISTETELTAENRKAVPQKFNQRGLKQLQDLFKTPHLSNKCSNLFH
jgi:hypothetical protein